MPCIYVQQGERYLGRIECFVGKVHDYDGVFASRKEDDGTLKLRCNLTEYVYALRF